MAICTKELFFWQVAPKTFLFFGDRPQREDIAPQIFACPPQKNSVLATCLYRSAVVMK